MKKLLLTILFFLTLTTLSYGYGIVKQGGTTSEDSITVYVACLDSLGNKVSCDSFYVAVFKSNANAVIFRDSGTTAMIGLDSIVLSGRPYYYYHREVAGIAGTAMGVYAGVILARKNSVGSAVWTTENPFSFQVTRNALSGSLDSAGTAARQDSAHANAIKILAVRDTSHNANVSALASRDSVHQANINIFAARDTAHNANVSALASNISALAARDTAHNANVSALASRDTSHAVNINVLVNRDSIHAVHVETDALNGGTLFNYVTDSVTVDKSNLGEVRIVTSDTVQANLIPSDSLFITDTLHAIHIEVNSIDGATPFNYSTDSVTVDKSNLGEVRLNSAETLAVVTYVNDIRNNDTTYSSNAGTGLDSATTSRILGRKIWGIPAGTGSDSTAYALRIVTSANAGTGLDSATTSRIVGRKVWGIPAGSGSDSTAYASRIGVAGDSVTVDKSNLGEVRIVSTDTLTTLLGNVNGSVASVTSEVRVNSIDTLTTILGNVNGNVGGNVTGSVASVTGEVRINSIDTLTQILNEVKVVSTDTLTTILGNVNGNVGGNVAGSVGSVTAEVRVNTIDTIQANLIPADSTLIMDEIKNLDAGTLFNPSNTEVKVVSTDTLTQILAETRIVSTETLAVVTGEVRINSAETLAVVSGEVRINSIDTISQVNNEVRIVSTDTIAQITNEIRIVSSESLAYVGDIRNNDTTYSSNAGTGLDSATTSRIIGRKTWGIPAGTGSDSSNTRQRRIAWADTTKELVEAVGCTGTGSDTLQVWAYNSTSPSMVSGVTITLKNTSGVPLGIFGTTITDGHITFNVNPGTYRLYPSGGAGIWDSTYITSVVPSGGLVDTVTGTSFTVNAPTDAATCSIYCFLKDLGVASEVGAKLEWSFMDNQYNIQTTSGTYVSTRIKSASSNALGYVSGLVYRSVSLKAQSRSGVAVDSVRVRVKLTTTDGRVFEKNNWVVPNSATYDLKGIFTY